MKEAENPGKQSAAKPGRKGFKRSIAMMLCAVLAIAMLSSCGSSSSGSYSDKNLQEQALPSNGAVLQGASSGDCGLTLENKSASNYYVKIIKPGASKPTVSFFVRGKQSATVSLEPGSYEIRYAAGDTWYGTSDYFGSKGSYGLFTGKNQSTSFSFDQGYDYSLTLNTSSGDGSTVGTKTIDQSSF